MSHFPIKLKEFLVKRISDQVCSFLCIQHFQRKKMPCIQEVQIRNGHCSFSIAECQRWNPELPETGSKTLTNINGSEFLSPHIFQIPSQTKHAKTRIQEICNPWSLLQDLTFSKGCWSQAHRRHGWCLLAFLWHRAWIIFLCTMF